MARQAVARAERLPISVSSTRARIARTIAIAYVTLGTVEAAFGNWWSEARVAAQRASDDWREVIATDSRLVDPARIARTEALLKDCNAHLH
jgi:hypothetical protein